MFLLLELLEDFDQVEDLSADAVCILLELLSEAAVSEELLDLSALADKVLSEVLFFEALASNA